MKRPTGQILAAAVSACALAGLLVVSSRVARHQQALPLATRAALGARARQVRARPAPPPAHGQRRPVTLCLFGAATMARAVADTLHIDVLDRTGRLDPAALARLANLTLSAERRAERAAGAEALPQRMGRQDGQPLEPATVRCRGIPAFARVPFD